MFPARAAALAEFDGLGQPPRCYVGNEVATIMASHPLAPYLVFLSPFAALAASPTEEHPTDAR